MDRGHGVGMDHDGDGAAVAGDQDLARLSNFLVVIVVVIAAAGAWGAGRRLLQQPGGNALPCFLLLRLPRNASTSAISRSLCDASRPWGPPSYSINWLFAMFFAARRAVASIGTVLSAVPWMMSVGT